MGLAVIGLGTFLPWLRSGRAEHDSFSAAGLLRREVDGRWLRLALTCWPFVAALAAAALVFVILGVRTVGTLSAVLVAALAAAGAAWTLAHTGDGIVTAVPDGPLCTLSGSAVVGLTAAATLFGSRRHRRN